MPEGEEMTLKDHLKAFWRRYFSGGLVGLAIAAIVSVQVNQPVQNSPVVRWVDNLNIELVNDFVITTRQYVIYEKAGFRSDGASEPRASWTALGMQPFSGASIEASLAHDGLYQGELLPRAECDLIFRELLFKAGVESNKTEIMYQAVSRAGGVVWSRHTPESIRRAREFVSVSKQ